MKEVQQILHELKLQIARCGISVFGVFTPPAELRGQQRRLATWQDLGLHSIDACLPLIFQVVEIIYYYSEFAWQGPVFNLTPAQVKFVRARGEGRARSAFSYVGGPNFVFTSEKCQLSRYRPSLVGVLCSSWRSTSASSPFIARNEAKSIPRLPFLSHFWKASVVGP